MALVTCPDCGKQISPNAVACPNCGAPISIRGNKYKERYIINPRVGKGKIVLGAILVFFGFAYLFVGAFTLGAVCIILGLVINITGKFQNWWNWR